MLAVVEWGLILEVIWVSLVAGIGATVLFSLVVFGSSRAAEARRTGGEPGRSTALLARRLRWPSFLGAGRPGHARHPQQVLRDAGSRGRARRRRSSAAAGRG